MVWINIDRAYCIQCGKPFYTILRSVSSTQIDLLKMNKVLIISKEQWELSTEQVMDWIWYWGGEVERLNGDVFEKLEHNIGIEMNGTPLLKIDKKVFELSSFNSVWFRRWGDGHLVDSIKNNLSREFIHDVLQNLKSDTQTIRDWVLVTLKNNNGKWLTTTDKFTINKLSALSQAVANGFSIPKTIITNEKSKLLEFYWHCNERVITKDISIPITISAFNKGFTIYAERVSLNMINILPERFPMSLFQGEVEKEYEIRSFYLNGAIFSMAIFSQSDDQTKIDFRHYNVDKPNRNVPYKLPEKIECSIKSFMTALDYQTGSFDFIKSKNGEYYFLEMNPIGQFGMVSSPCNYNIEKKIAEYLLLNN
jgi:ATP-GRASP peptide maturase of grasp-with-spasm system